MKNIIRKTITFLKVFVEEYIIRKKITLLEILAGKWAFSGIAGCFFYILHIRLSKGVFVLSNLEIKLNGVHEIVSADNMKSFDVLYMVTMLIAYCLFSFILYRWLFERYLKQDVKRIKTDTHVHIPSFPWDSSKLQIVVGLKHNKFDTNLIENPEYAIIPESALYQNILVTGTIGTGKTASVMYSFLKQVMFHQANLPDEKVGMLVLDVKGNFYKKVLDYAAECGRQDDVLLIQLDGDYKYNPLHKPYMEPIDLAERSRQVIDLFSKGGKKEAFWDTKSAQMMTECIRLMRLTNQYVTLADVHELVTNDDFLIEQLTKLNENIEEIPAFEFNACVNYFGNEFTSKAETTIATIKACVTEMTGFFASSQRINNAFCPPIKEVNFIGFEEVINKGKIVVLAMNIAKYPKVAKTIAAYLKLDFQAEVQQRTEEGNTRLNRERPVFFVSDEYQEFVTENDAGFYGLSRESKCCSIVSSQSYTSILRTLGRKEDFDTLQQNLINKIWLRTDDKLTIDTAQLLTGKEEKAKYSKNISESTSDAKRSKVFGNLMGHKASMSESINVSTQKDFVFEEKIFTQTLQLFTAICFLANEMGMTEPHLVHLLPYFREPILSLTINKKAELEEGKNTSNEEEADIIIQLQ